MKLKVNDERAREIAESCDPDIDIPDLLADRAVLLARVKELHLESEDRQLRADRFQNEAVANLGRAGKAERDAAAEAARAERLAAALRWAQPHIGDEYQRSWPDDEEFDAGRARVQAALDMTATQALAEYEATLREQAAAEAARARALAEALRALQNWINSEPMDRVAACANAHGAGITGAEFDALARPAYEAVRAALALFASQALAEHDAKIVRQVLRGLDAGGSHGTCCPCPCVYLVTALADELAPGWREETP